MNDSTIPVLPPAAQRVRDALAAGGVAAAVHQLAASARTAQEAADALGVEVGQIAKSLIFRACASDRALLVIAAGDRRVDESRVGQLLGEPIERARPDFVRTHSGFAIGGVAPVAHAQKMVVYVDRSLRRFETVWAAAGTPHCVFPIDPASLARVSGGTEADVTI
jgi:prolyl-tRNA editing enzyme YbaK/EbsC (Cys-tRNA(Pro) deacylase)